VILHGDCIDVMKTLPAESVDALVSDPPYGIGFMGKEWDTFKPGMEAKRIVPNKQARSDNPNLKGRTRGPASSPSAVEYDYSRKGLVAFQMWTEQWAREAFRVLKPGAHAVVCGAPRAYHRMACGLEDAGFEIRDCLAWLFGSGFPKSLNLGGGLGTALKPAHEPIVLARKPFKGTVKGNVEKFGTGALNIDACRIEYEEGGTSSSNPVVRIERGCKVAVGREMFGGTIGNDKDQIPHDLGRWPANVCLDDLAAMVLDEQSGELTSSIRIATGTDHTRSDSYTPDRGLGGNRGHEDIGGASRFYYIAKPSREERDFGCGRLPSRSAGECTDREEGSAGLTPRAGAGRTGGGRNYHPTVKPVELMRWLVKLVTPINGTVLDPFLGSGTTGMACKYEQRQFIGIEREAEYIAIAEQRIGNVAPLFSEASA
jgi:DNA modification methylase